jgi:hypothetical protein
LTVLLDSALKFVDMQMFKLPNPCSAANLCYPALQLQKNIDMHPLIVRILARPPRPPLLIELAHPYDKKANLDNYPDDLHM